MAATAPPSPAELLDLLRRSGILPADRLKVLPAADSLPADPDKAATALVQQGFITKFQATQLLAGRHKGFRIGQHVIRDMLGRGGMGAVYLAEHLDLHRKVAIKVLAPGKNDDHRLALERFLREARAAAALDHPNIVRIFDVSRHNETPYLVMEYVDGESLQQALDRAGRILPEAAAECIAQAAAGLQHAHEKGFVHRDIKPANLIRDRFGTVKILDMGLARSGSDRDKLTEQLDEGAVVGTADYISPEQAINCPNVDSRADIYSLGATLFTLIVGKPLFEGNTTQKLMQHQIRTAPALREQAPAVPPELAEVVAKMLAKKPGDRYQTAAEVIEALAPWSAASAHVLAGLSRTRLGATNSGTALQERANGSQRLLGRRPSPSDAIIDTTESGNPTGVLSAEDTLRDPAVTSPEPAYEPKPRQQWLALIGVSVALVCTVVLGAWLAFGRGKSPTIAEVKPEVPAPAPVTPTPTPQPPVTNPPKANPPKVDPPKLPAPEPVKEEVVYRFDPATVAAFQVRLKGGTVVDGKRGALPTGVGVYALKEGEAEFTAGPVDGTAAFAIRRHAAVGDTHIALELERDAAQGLALKLKPDTEYKLRFRYRSEGGGQLSVSVHTLNYRPTASKTLPATGGKWVPVELPFTRGADPLRVTLAAVGPVASQAAIGPIEVVEIRTGRTRLTADFATVKPFVVRSGLTVDPADPNKKNYRFVSQTGSGALPAGWVARGWNPDSEMEVFADEHGGSPAIGIRNVRGPATAMLFTPRFECLSGAALLRFEYAANTRDKAFLVRFKPDDQRRAWDVVRPAVGGEAWRTEELLVDLKSAVGGFFEFHNSDAAPSTTVRVRAVSVVEPNPALVDRVVFKLDASDLPSFKNIKTGRNKTSGDDNPQIKGVYFGGWKSESESEWVCAPVAGAKALGFTNLNDVVSAQIGINLESEMGLTFAPGQTLRLRVTYRTAGKGHGSAYFQTTTDYKVLDRVVLPSSNNEWKTVELAVTRGDSPLRCLVDTAESGAGNTMFVRSVTVSAVGARPAVAPLTALNFADAQPGSFEITVGAAGRKKPTGSGASPAGWFLSHTGNSDGDAKYECRVEDDRTLVGFRKLSGKGGVQFHGRTGPPMLAGRAYTLTIEYRSGPNFNGRVEVRRKWEEWTNVPHKLILGPTGGQWERKSLSMVPTEDWPTLLVVQNLSKELTGHEFDFRLLEIVSADQPTIPPAPTEPASGLLTWTEGATVYKLDVASIPTFRTQKENWQRIGGDTERLPVGVGCQCWKEKAVGDFRCEKFDGAPALGVTNLNDEQSGQFYFNLEGTMKLPLQPGKSYRVKVGYRTANDANGGVTVHVVPGFKSVSSAPLSSTTDQWKTATVSFTRPPESDKVEMRMVIDNFSVGEGNTVWVRSVEIVELTPPPKK